jgi:hypothetical protein
MWKVIVVAQLCGDKNIVPILLANDKLEKIINLVNLFGIT